MAEVYVLSRAEADLGEAIDWYSQRSRRATEDLIAEYTKAIKLLEKHADRYPVCDDRHRYLLLRRFPYQIIYRIDSADRVTIVSFSHTHRRPQFWMER